MCTVLYIPLENGFIMSSNRDENPLRPPASLPMKLSSDSLRYLCPVDAKAGGTWIGINSNDDILIVLNGGYETHPFDVYGKSRGLIVSELLSKSVSLSDWNKIELDGIEPFTMVVKTKKSLQEWVWDGQVKYQVDYALDKPAIWSSSTLYTKEMKEDRKEYFLNWWNNVEEKSTESVLNLLESNPDTVNGYVMNRQGRVQTLSIAIIEQKESSVSFFYKDILNSNQKLQDFELD